MRCVRLILAFTLSLPVISAACGGGDKDNEPFDTLQACFDDHHKVESFGVEEAIKICCIDHPIGAQAANVVCGNDQTACETYVNASLADADATAAQITSACTGYLTDRNK
jgi:hypothetical protein